MVARRAPLLGLLAISLPALLVFVSALALSAQGAGTAEFRGRYLLRHSDDFAGGKARFEPVLELADSTLLDLDFGARRPPDLPPGAQVRVRGVRQGSRVLVADGGAQVTSTAPSPTATQTQKRVAVVLFNFADDTREPYTPVYAASVAFTSTTSVAAYYAASTWGRVAITGDVFGWYTISSSNSGCNYLTWASQANSAASNAGVNLNAYDHVVYAFPSASGCSWAGLAYLPGRSSWLNGASAMSLRVMAHELGHNFGTHHASALSCTEDGVRVTLSSTSSSCTSSEYGDPFTVMGSSNSRKHTAFSLGNFGWLPAERTQTVTAAGDYALSPLHSASGIQALQIQRTSSTYFTLELRSPSTPFDTFSATDPAVNGVSIRITGPYSSRTRSQLLDTTPSTTGFGDGPLTAGKTFVDPLTGISITTLSASTSGAVVRIAFSPSSDTQAPTQPGNLRATALDSSRVSLTWSASSDNVGVAGYRVFRDGRLLATVTTTSYSDTGLQPATTYGYHVVAFDAAGNTSAPASASVTTPPDTPPPPPDTEPPSVPQNLTATAGKGRKVLLAWHPSSDNVGVAGYRIFRDGRFLATVQSPGYTDTLGAKVSSATYAVVAFDVAGNTSAPAVTVYSASG